MRRLKTIVTVLVLALWASCTAHCMIENLRQGAQSSCCDEEGGPSDQAPQPPGHCVCGAIQAGGYVSADGAVSVPAALEGVVLFVCAPEAGDLVAPPHSALPGLCPSPPGPPEPWQFSFRAALPARAPALAS